MTTAEELTPLARELHAAGDPSARPDLVLRLVHLLLLLKPDNSVPS